MTQLCRAVRLVSQGAGICLAAATALVLPAAAAVAGPAAPAAPAANQPSWVPIGPQGGSLSVVAAAPGGTVYAGAVFGGVLRSDDGGRHWNLPTSGLPAGYQVDALAVVPGRPEIVYAGGQQFGPYLSSDGGATWLRAAEGFRITLAEPVVIQMAATVEGSAVYALAPYGYLYKTVPGSRSWARLGPPDAAGSILADPQRPSTLYIATASGVYRTSDGGETWNLLGGGTLPRPAFLSPLLAIDPATPGSLYMTYFTASGSTPVVFTPTLFHSSDDGRSWASRPLPAGSNPISVAVAPGGRVILTQPYSPQRETGLLESGDGGSTWTVPPGDPDDIILGMAAAPGEAATLYACGGRGFWLSTDGGDHWRPSSGGLFAQSIYTSRVGADASSTFLYASVFAAFAPQLFYLFRRETGGAFRQVGGSDYTVLGVDPRRPEVVYGSTLDDSSNLGLWKSADGGLTWAALGLSPEAEIDVFAIDPDQPSTLYAGGHGVDATHDDECWLGKSRDGGKTWTCRSRSPYLSPYYLLIEPGRDTNLFLLTTDGEVHASRDGGASWKPASRGLPPIPAVTVVALDPAHSGRLYAAVQLSDPTATTAATAATAAIYLSNDSAERWALLAAGLPGPITSLAVDPHQPQTLYAGVAFSGGGIFRSVDGGRHWGRFDAGIPPGQFVGGFHFDPLQPATLYTVTLGAGLYQLDTGQ